MELKLEVVLSSSIKRKKPWPRFCWLGQEKESVFLLDDRRISEINMVSGRTKKKTPKLHPLLSSVVTMASSHSGMWLCGLLVSGELFLWNRDKDLLKTATSVPEVVQIITSTQGNSKRLSVQVSCDGMRVLLVAITGQAFLWECMDLRDLIGVRDGPVKGQWMHIQPLDETILPSPEDKESSQHTIFVKTEVMGDTCLSAFVFISGKHLVITLLKIQWKEVPLRVGPFGYSIQWATKTYPLSHLTPPCQAVKSRGALVPAFSPDGQLLAIALNQRNPKATQVLFVSTQNFVSISSCLGGCGSKKMDIPSKYIRSYWVGSVSWSPGSLFLACVLKRGSLLMLFRLGGLLTLTSSGCSVDFGPAHFLPLHPLVTYRAPMSGGKGDASLSSSSISARDILRQRYSVTWHPRLLYLIVSDGYMATVVRVLDRPSPALLLKTLLKQTSKDLEKASCKLEKSQAHVKSWLDFVSCLNLDGSLEDFNFSVTCEADITEPITSEATEGSRLPLFLQGQQRLGGIKELFESAQAFLDDESDVDGFPAGPHVEERGRLEFASMFDTLHAVETQNDTLFVGGPNYIKDFVETGRKTPLHRELGKIQSGLLTAWAFGMSLGDSAEHRVQLLEHTLWCVVRFAALLHLMPTSMGHTGEKSTSINRHLLHLIKTLLSFLPWDSKTSNGPHCLRLVVEFSKRIVRLLLTPLPDSSQTGHCRVSSQSLDRIVFILQLVSDALDHTYSLNHKTVWSSGEEESPSQQPNLWDSDVYHVPLLQDEKEEKYSDAHQALPAPQRPSSRLLGVWRLVYDITQQYAEQLKKFKGCDGWKKEEEQLSLIMSQIQAALQATGQRLEEGPALLGYHGEHLFLCGSYTQSANALLLQICQESNKSFNRSVFQQTRLCLALLYSLLSQYHLREAQELGDHMVQIILLRAGHHRDSLSSVTDSLPCTWLPTDLHSDAACAVVQTLGRFMTSYFTNQPLYILSPHSVAVLPPLHLPYAPTVGRLVPLCQEEVARAVRQQHLSDVWTVGYAQELLLLGGLLPEAVWMAYHLEDWKTAVSLSLAYTSFCTEHVDSAWLRRRELHLPKVLEPKSIFQAELECLLGNKPESLEYADKNKSIEDSLEEEDWDLLQASIQEILKASVMAGVNVMSSPLSSLLDAAKDMCSSLLPLVPAGLYLPSPPLYCPQPSSNTQDQKGTVGHFGEVACRHKVSGVIQRFLLLLRSGHCCHPAAQWYISHLRRARRMLHKIKKKYSYPSAAHEEKPFPEALLKLITYGGYFRRGQNKDGHLDHDTINTIMCFRELCALCWMLHVRDQLSIHCRKYQVARQHAKLKQISYDPEVNSACVDALCWACRLLPFSHFLSAEEVLQDIVLSLISELPPLSMALDTLVRTFPEEEESVRVPLREKYNSLMERLKQCSVLEEEKGEGNEAMMTLIHNKFKQRRKHLVRLQRHLATPELHLWERDEEEENRESKPGMALLRQLSLGTSLSTSTLTDCGLQTVSSDIDTAENTSEATVSEQHCGDMTRAKKATKDREHTKKSAVKIKNAIQEEGHSGGQAKEKEKPSPPVVGTWEFELEDEEYLNFLDLFLSYVLEKGSTDGANSGSELPLLKGFCAELRKRELHSLTFDVLTTIHRRQREEDHPERTHLGRVPPVFRAGSCYKPAKEVSTPEQRISSIQSKAPLSRASLPISFHPGQRTVEQGLFGLRQQRNAPPGRVKGAGLSFETSLNQSAFAMGDPPKSFISDSSLSVETVTELQQGLNPKLEAQFPKLGRLLEWMVRWADRRVRLGHRVKMKKANEGTTDEGVVIRVKASAPAILTSLSLLKWRYAALIGTDRFSSHIHVPKVKLTVAPVLQPEVERKLDKESSVDTGYPGSAHTPIIGLDHNLQPDELSIGSCTTVQEPEELMFQGTPLPGDQSQMGFDSQHSSPQQQFLDDLDVTPEKESRVCNSEDLDVSFSESSKDVSANIFTPEMSLKLADLDLSEKAEEVSSSSSLHSFPAGLPDCSALSTVQPKATVLAKPSDTSAMLLPNTDLDSPSLQPQSSTAPVATPIPTGAPIATDTPTATGASTTTGAPTATGPSTAIGAPVATDTPTATGGSTVIGAPTATGSSTAIGAPVATDTPTATGGSTVIGAPTATGSSTAIGAPVATGTPAAETTTLNHPLATSLMRQRLGEDLFRLVQHINYMNLSEVLGASFSNVQLLQQSLSVPQADMTSTNPNVPLSSAKFNPESNASSIQTAIPASPQTLIHVPNSRSSDPQFGQTAACKFEDQPALRSSDKTSAAADQHFDNQRLPSKSSDAGVNVQEMQPLTIQAESPDIQQRETRNLIPSSQALLTTTDYSHIAQKTQVLLPFNGGALNGSAPQVSGVKLLKIRHPLSSQYGTPHYPAAQLTLHSPNPETVGSYQHKLKHDNQAMINKKRREERNRFSVPTKPLSFNPQCDPAPRNSQPQISTVGKPNSQGFSLLPPGFPAPTPTPMQGLRLLQLQPAPPSSITFPCLPRPSDSRPSAVIAAPVTDMHMIKLLHIESGPKMMLPQAVSSTHMNRLVSMRELQSSRTGQQEAETTRMQLHKVDQSPERLTPSSSYTPSKREKRREEKAKGRKTEVTFRPNDSIIPAQEVTDVPACEEPVAAEDITPIQNTTGSPDSLLTGQRLLNKVFSTAAELHAFASTSKQPPECQDAFTNTDPCSPPLLVEKAVSVQASVISDSQKLQSNDDPVRDTQETPQEPQKILDHCGRQFISVLDIEDEHEALSPCRSPEEQHAPSIHPSSPSSAELHVLATSVIRGSAAAEPQPSVTVLENFQKPATQLDILEGSPSLNHYQPSSKVAESVTQKEDAIVDPNDSEICQVIKTQSSGTPRAFSSCLNVWFSSRLSELDTQLAGLQNIADNLETDFSNSRMLVKRLEKLSSDISPNVKTPTAAKKTVRLSVPLEAWTPRPEPALSAKLNPCEERKKNEDEKHVVSPGTKPSLHISTSSGSHRAGSSLLQSPPGMKDPFLEMLHECSDVNLGQTELSDTVEILDELVREGYLSPTDWDLSTSQSAHHDSMQDQHQISWTSPKSDLPQNDRREVRMWMRKKQRERHAAYQKHRESLREKERKPFSSSSTRQSPKKNQTTIWGTREEKEKFMLLEQYKQRTHEACRLALDFLDSPGTLHSSSQTASPLLMSTSWSTSAPPHGRTYVTERICNRPFSAKRSHESLSGQAVPHISPQSVRGRLSEDLHMSLGLDRPVTVLPGDRLSQVTRRGMLSTKTHSKLNSPSQSDRGRAGYQDKAGLSSNVSPGAAVGGGLRRDWTTAEEEEVVNHRESHTLQGTEESNDLAGLLCDEEDGARGCVSEMDWLDNLSESAGSSLSKIDWAAIERMVAEEEP